jgi:transposase
MRLAEAHPDWALGFQDEVWWSRLAQPSLRSWAEAGAPLRLQELTRPPDDRDPKALACYGVLVRRPGRPKATERMLLRFVDGRPVSAVTIDFLKWSCQRLARRGVKVWALIWDNASWHVSRAVRTWIRDHNRQVKRTGKGVRILACYLPSKSPWLNPIEPKWLHGKRAIVEPDRLLSPDELADRVCARFNCVHEPHLKAPEKVP